LLVNLASGLTQRLEFADQDESSDCSSFPFQQMLELLRLLELSCQSAKPLQLSAHDLGAASSLGQLAYHSQHEIMLEMEAAINSTSAPASISTVEAEVLPVTGLASTRARTKKHCALMAWFRTGPQDSP